MMAALKKKNEAYQKKENEEEENWETMPIILTAAKNGILKMVERMLSYAPAYIQEVTRDGKNILLVTAENRQPYIVGAMHRQRGRDVWKNLIRATDNENNNILHLAARMSKHEAWHITRSAMQMHWESTSESCSVVAALIAGVAYATTSNLPGGTNDNIGKPTLVEQPVFNMFLVTSLLALCFYVTALVMFLSILTSRQQPKYYKWELPLKLLLGLSSLFVSIAAMLISFYSAYFLVFKDGMHHIEFIIIYAATCLPVMFYTASQFPLYWNLIKAIFTNVPQPDHGQA
ncbi:uncharacterized protein DS421_4g116540 [Arachis hypogaea]|nr:uncharacterized protein DS421_4g116540 [Arachis hypogaea]